MSALRSIAALMAGVGKGLVERQEDEYKKKRQEELDQRLRELHEAQMEEIANKRGDRQAIADAYAPRTTMEGMAVTAPSGTNLYKDPTQAEAAAEDARIEAEMRGQNPNAVMISKATGITGNMSKGHQITSGPVDLNALNSPDAKLRRAVQALAERGSIEKAISMEGSALDLQGKRLGLERDQLRFADEKFNRDLSERMARHPNWWEGAAAVLTETKVGGLDGTTVQSKLSEDGKKVDMVAVGPDGQSRVLRSFATDESGQRQFMQEVMKVSPETKIAWLKEANDAKVAAERWEKEYGVKLAELEIKALTAKSQAELRAAQAEAADLRARILRGDYGPSGAGGGSAGGGMSWEDQRKVLSDYAALLPDPKSIPDAAEAAAQQKSNAEILAKVNAVFTTNARFGAALVAPEIQQALTLAQDPKNVLTRTDANTGQTYNMVVVNGKPVIVDVAVAPAPKPASPPGAAPAAGAPAAPPKPPQPPASATPAPAAPKPKTLVELLGGNSNSEALNQIAQKNAVEIQSMADTIRAAQAKVANAARTGGNVQAAMQEVVQARAALDKKLSTMNPQLAAAVNKAVGL